MTEVNKSLTLTDTYKAQRKNIKKWYILKPAARSQGKGIFVFNNLLIISSEEAKSA